MTRTKKFLLVGLFATALPVAALAGGFGGHFGPPRAETAEEARDHADRMAERALDRVDATDAQRAQVDAVLDTAVPKMFAIHEDGAALREQGRDLFTAPTIDRAAVESLRAEAMTLADEGSRLMADTAVQIATILTPEQRQDLGAAMDKWHDEGGPRGRGGPGERGQR
jgi:protein CpxP